VDVPDKFFAAGEILAFGVPIDRRCMALDLHIESVKSKIVSNFVFDKFKIFFAPCLPFVRNGRYPDVDGKAVFSNLPAKQVCKVDQPLGTVTLMMAPGKVDQ
jgi:hypothetical protein